MVILIVAVMFLTFAVVDMILERKRRTELLRAGQSFHEALEKTEPRWVAGYQLPDSLHYHQGHTWVHWVSPELAYVGVDDFARRLVGKPSKISPPPVGSYVHLGEPAVKLERGGDQAELLSPVSGEVVGINPRLKGEPDVLHQDSYGNGWLYKIRAPQLFKELPNLLHGSLATRWMEDVQERFNHRLMLATGSVIQDGGTPVEDLAEALDHDEWKSLVNDFLLQQDEVK